MKLVLRNFLASLKEDGELDRICVELLKDHGLAVFAAPQKGVRQYGVDVLAKGRLSSCEDECVYALIIKCKDIDRNEFERPETGIRASIIECLDVYASNHLPEECEGVSLKICIVCGGEIKPEVRENINSLFAREKDYHSRNGRIVMLEEWNGARLAELLNLSLANENLLVRGQKRLLFRSLALASEPDLSVSAFNALVDDLIVKSMGVSQLEECRILHCVPLALAMLITECNKEEVNNRDAAWRAAEYAYLKLWERKKKPDCVIDDVARLYCIVAEQYIDRISLFIKERHAFTLSIHGNNEVDVILRFYDVLGRLASFGSYLCSIGQAVEIRHKLLLMLEQMLAGNVAAVMPLLDSHASPIGMTMWYLCADGRRDLAEVWLELLVPNLLNAFKQGYAYPAVGLDYRQLIGHMHPNARSSDIARSLPSSELIPVLLLVAQVLARDDLTHAIVQLAESLPHGIDYQVWFTDSDSDESFYNGATNCGAQLCTLPINDVAQFVKIIEDESAHSPIQLSCTCSEHRGLLYIGCRYYNFPLPGNFWTASISKSRLDLAKSKGKGCHN